MAEIVHKRRVRPEMVPEPPASGWPELHKTVRTADINKVDDCRDDIDTLLVFAGLYSAVLTAFVIESYTHLQQDTQDVIVGLLQQLVAQNFTSGPRYMNSTTPSPAPTPFEPPLWAVRVNVLWFTSLLLSLASASFGILVKQWLREYLAIEYSTPRERLRARQYRSPAMSDWKVFEIAAFLPLLLQVSLGLFFIGLCFFTAAVHDSVGRTTAPLVSAWAFLFLLTTIAPLFSPRCPYKTTFLKRALRIGRCYARPPFRGMLRFFGRPVRSRRNFLATWWESLTGIFPASTEDLASRMEAFCGALAHMSASIPWKWAAILSHIVCFIILSPAILLVGAFYELWRSLDLWKRSASKATSEEEEQVIQTEEEDIGVLLSVDFIVSDDGLLTTMLDALRQQTGASSERILQFISQIIRRRVGRDVEVLRLTNIPDLCPLSKLAWSAVTNALAGLLRDAPVPLDASSPHWVLDSVAILLSPSRFELSNTAVDVIRKLIPNAQRTSDHQCTAGITVGQAFTEGGLALEDHNLAQRLLRMREPDTVICLRCVMDVCTFLLCQDPTHSHPSLRHLLDMHMSENAFVSSSKGLLQALSDVLIPFLLWTTSEHMDWAGIPGSHEALHIILQYNEKFGKLDEAVTMCYQMLLTDFGTRVLLVPFAALDSQRRVSDHRGALLHHVNESTSMEERVRIGLRLTSAFEWFCDGGGDVPLDHVRLCKLCVWMKNVTMDRALANAIQNYHRTQGWQKEIGCPEYWYSGAHPPAPSQTLREDQALA